MSGAASALLKPIGVSIFRVSRSLWMFSTWLIRAVTRPTTCGVPFPASMKTGPPLSPDCDPLVTAFASDAQVKAFLREAPLFEKMLVDDGILLFKYWLCCDQEQQEKRFTERLRDPLKRWKLSPIDLEARQKYADYTRAREAMLKATHSAHAPWTLVDFNDQKRGRLTLIRNLLDRLPDTTIDTPKLEFPPLSGKPAKERYGVLKPIASIPG